MQTMQRGRVVVAEVPSRDERERPAALFWRRYFEFYDTLREAIPYKQLIQRHVELLEPAPGERVLDAGTGTGNVAERLLAAGAEVVGIDFCSEALEICRAKCPDGEFAFGDLTARLDFDDGSFDKVACCNVIYTLEPDGQRRAVAELYRLLKPGGKAAITVFGLGFKALKVYATAIREQYRASGLASTVGMGVRYSVNTARILYYVKRIKGREKSGAYTFYTRDQLAELLRGAGFRVDRVEPVFADQCLIALASKPATQAAVAGRSRP